MSRDQHVAGLSAQPIAYPLRWIARLEISGRRERRQGVAGPPERVSRLAGSQLAAVPHDGRAGAPARRIGSRSLYLLAAPRREGPPGIDVRADGLSVVDEKEAHARYGLR
jgi:hypothetical protein